MKGSPPNPEHNPNVFAWFCLVGKFSEAIRGTWGAGASAGAKQGDKKEQKGKQTKGGDAKAHEKVTEETTKPAEEEEFDPFGEENEEDVAEKER